MGKRILYIIITILGLLSSVQCSAQWYELNCGTTNALNALYFVNKDTGYVVGYEGTIMKTTNAGQSWETQNSGSTQILMSVYFINDDTGYVVGYINDSDSTGIIIKTTNGGESWLKKNQSINQYRAFFGIYFTSADTGYTVTGEGQIYITNDGGNNWQLQYIDTTQWLYSVYFINSKTGFVAGGMNADVFPSKIFKTIDGGNHWIVSFSTDSLEYFTQIYFADSLTGYAVSGWNPGLSVVMTKNGGKSWEIKTEIAGATQTLYGVYFNNRDTGYVVGGLNGPSVILKTMDGGISWKSQKILNRDSISVVGTLYFTDVNTGYAVGWNNSANGIILKTTNGGDWVEQLTMNNGQWTIYPVPVNKVLNIDYTSSNQLLYNNSLLQIFNIQGQELLRQYIRNNKEQIDVCKLDEGVYIVKISNDKTTEIRKIVKIN